VAKKKASAAKFNSHSTPGHQMDISSWLVELAMTRKNLGIKLPPYFWREVKYKFAFMREIKAVKKFIKEYGEKAILEISIKEYLTTYTDYAQMQVFLQRIRERAERLALPKDTSEVKPEVVFSGGTDLREDKPAVAKKKLGLFERLSELQSDDEAVL
jgi:hypothetical protein